MKSFLQDAIERKELIKFSEENETWMVNCKPVDVSDVFSAEELKKLELSGLEHHGTDVRLQEDDDSNYLRVRIVEDEHQYGSEVMMSFGYEPHKQTLSISVAEDALYRFAQLVVASIDAKRNANNA